MTQNFFQAIHRARTVQVQAGEDTDIYYNSADFGPALNKAQAVSDALLAALEDAEFLLRKIAINPAEAWAIRDSFTRSAQDARAAITKATQEA